jgi:hypothetical protein
MSFKSREKKRRAKIAQGRDKRAPQADRRYITIVSRPACCNKCGAALRKGADCVYRYEPREILCVNCATLQKIRYRTSLRWERHQDRKRKGGRSAAKAR